jgi:hypothetical protein
MDAERTITIHLPQEIANDVYSELQKSFDVILADIATPFLQSVVAETFTTEGASQGSKWTPLHDSGKQMRKKRGYSVDGPILQSSGTLASHAMDIRSQDNTSIFIGPPEDLMPPYPSKYPAGPRYWQAIQERSNYPRVFMSVTDKQWDQLLGLINDFIRNTLGIPGITLTFNS